MSIPVALTIAGSDSGGGAGIQADLKTFHAFGVFGTSAITAITAQNTLGVFAVHPVPVDIIGAQIDAVVSDLAPAAVKSGMLATSEIIRAVAGAIDTHALRNYVLDPVMVSTSGARLLDAGAETALREVLMPLSALVTPNLDEAAVLVGGDVRSVAQMEDAARFLVSIGARGVLIKGGHLEAVHLTDVYYDGVAMRRFERKRIATSSTHGTGCTLSAAIAAGLARGRSMRDAIESALDFVYRAISSAPNLGRGSGPLNHFLPAERPQ